MSFLGRINIRSNMRFQKRPDDATEWEEPVEFSNSRGKETYVSPVIDKADTLHLVSRMQNDDLKTVSSLHAKEA
jgi:hypothetical protein